MGVSPDTTDAELKQQYNDLSKLFHPDKKVNITEITAPPNHPREVLEQFSPDARRAYYDQKRLYDLAQKQIARLGPDRVNDQTALTQELNEAWAFFRTPTDRALYNYVSGYAGSPEYWYTQYHELKAKDYQSYTRIVEDEYFAQLQQWEAAYSPAKKNTPPPNFPEFFIIEALYGDVVPASSKVHRSPAGKCIDVTFILRKAADQHRKIESQPGLDLDNKIAERYGLHHTFALQSHFFDPNFEQPGHYNTVLYIRYLYKNELHECYIPDSDTLLQLPNKDHKVAKEDLGCHYDRYDANTYPDHWVDNAFELGEHYKMDLPPPVSNDMAAVIKRYATPLQDAPTGLPTTEFLMGPKHPVTPRKGVVAPQESAVDLMVSANAPNVGGAEDDEVGSALLHSAPVRPYENLRGLQPLPSYLLSKQLYSEVTGPALPRKVWDKKMEPIKKKRRRVLYAVLTGLLTTLLSILQWRGVVDVLSWPTTITQVGCNLIEFIQDQAAKKAERKDQERDV